MRNTIFALATGNQMAALSVIRVSGEDSEKILKKLTLKNTPKERLLTLRSFYFPKSNKKLIDRGTRIISEITGLEYDRAQERLVSAENSVKLAIVMEKFKCNLEEAKAMLKNVDGFLHRLVKNK